jgi:hypothetical protein
MTFLIKRSQELRGGRNDAQDPPIGAVDLVLAYMLLQALSQAGIRVLKVQKAEST